jgi:hypothetical protein
VLVHEDALMDVSVLVQAQTCVEPPVFALHDHYVWLEWRSGRAAQCLMKVPRIFFSSAASTT